MAFKGNSLNKRVVKSLNASISIHLNFYPFMKLFFTLIFATISLSGFASDSLITTQLLERIAFLQTKEDRIFPKGSIPSYRMYAHNKDRFKADINPFFTALVSFTLLDIHTHLSDYQKKIASQIIGNSLSVFEKFKNRKNNYPTYNFWPTDTPQIFPNAGWLNQLDKSRSLPDDLDDTVIILMAMQASDSIAILVHELMQKHVNNNSNPVKNTFKEYRKLGAYSTWFGKKMPTEFDISVLMNVLYFVQKYNLDWSAADSASLGLIKDAIKTRKHIDHANYISHHYAKTSIVLYHLARLMSLKPIPSLESLKPQLISQANMLFNQSNSFMEQILLSTSLLKWGAKPPEISIGPNQDLTQIIEDETFSFFIANMGSIYPDQVKKFLTRSKLGTFYYYSPAYNNLLVLENLIWQKRMSQMN